MVIIGILTYIVILIIELDDGKRLQVHANTKLFTLIQTTLI